MLAGKYPFYDSTATRLFEKIRKVEFSLPSYLDISLDARVIINSLLRFEPDRRLVFKTILGSSWSYMIYVYFQSHCTAHAARRMAAGGGRREDERPRAGVHLSIA